MAQATIDPAADDAPGTPRTVRMATAGGVGFTTLVVIAAFVTLIDVSQPGGYFLVEMVLAFVWLVLALTWAVLALVVLVRAASARSLLLQSWVWLAAPALVVVVTVGLYALDSPLKARFALSKSSMTTHAGNVGGYYLSEPPTEAYRRVRSASRSTASTTSSGSMTTSSSRVRPGSSTAPVSPTARTVLPFLARTGTRTSSMRWATAGTRSTPTSE